tara:strand:- start:118 stop:657 length:540 start_codon:yes stop_codon:yes gene_type:complete
MSEEKNELIKYTKQDFIAKFEPVKMVMEYRDVKSIEMAISKDSNGIAFYSKHLGMDAILATIELHLVGLNEAINVKQPLNKFQIKEIAVEILTTYYYLNMVEIAFIFRKAKRGEFGKMYGALSMVDILTWFAQYGEERSGLYMNNQLANRFNDDSMRSEDRKMWANHEKIINKNSGKED